MKQIIVLIFLFVINFNESYGISIKSKEVRILFIGNGIIYANGMSTTLQKMVEEQKLNFKIDQLVFPKFCLYNFATQIVNLNGTGDTRRAGLNETPIGVKKILSEKWDFVVLQEVGGYPLIREFSMFSFEPSFIYLDSIIKNIKGKTILLEGYANSKFPAQLFMEKNYLDGTCAFSLKRTPENGYSSMLLTDKYCSNKFLNSGEEFSEIDKLFEKIARKTKAGLVKVGHAFEVMKKNHPEVQLYGEENLPSKQGSYLIACLFFKYLTGKNLQHVKYSADLDPKEAQLIRKFADTIH